VGKFNGQACHVANYRDSEGNVVAQKLRFRDKSFVWLGETTKVGLYGSHLWRNEGKMVVVTEGELDALSVNQAFGLKYPCVSIPNGCKSAKRLIAKNIDWLETFETVVLCFDQDEQGRAAAKEAAEVLSPGKVKIVTSLGFKDANEALMNGNSKAIVDGIYGAKT
jgi:twinkle protein